MSESGAPAGRYAAVTKSDTTVVDCRGIYVGGTGDLVLEPFDGGTTVTFKNVAAGVCHPISAYRIMAATTATLLVALY